MQKGFQIRNDQFKLLSQFWHFLKSQKYFIVYFKWFFKVQWIVRDQNKYSLSTPVRWHIRKNIAKTVDVLFVPKTNVRQKQKLFFKPKPRIDLDFLLFRSLWNTQRKIEAATQLFSNCWWWTWEELEGREREI